MIFSPRPFNSTWASLQRYFSITFSFHNLQHILKRTDSDCLCAVLECGNCTQHNVQGFLALGLQQDVHLECLNTKAHTRTTGLWSPCCTFELSWCDHHIWMWWLGVDHRNISTMNTLECLSSIQIYGKCKLAEWGFPLFKFKGRWYIPSVGTKVNLFLFSSTNTQNAQMKQGAKNWVFLQSALKSGLIRLFSGDLRSSSVWLIRELETKVKKVKSEHE